MRNWLRNFEVTAVAAAFAEEGQWMTALSVLDDAKDRKAEREVDRKSRPHSRSREQTYRV
jgi:hypothetical protein